jgi:hypothetical protein
MGIGMDGRRSIRTEIEGIVCYGAFRETSNVLVIGTWNDTDGEFEEFWCNDTEEKNWEGVVRELKGWAGARGLTIDELVAC